MYLRAGLEPSTGTLIEVFNNGGCRGNESTLVVVPIFDGFLSFSPGKNIVTVINIKIGILQSINNVNYII